MFSSVLRKSFNTGKWKTLLRLAISRIKLLRNKRDMQLKQMKRDLAQLLHNKQELTAHIRVEHVYREQNVMATYDIIELFCELLVVRLPIIESQRSCPIDLKEAVASLAFAAPRCADLPELQQLSRLFAAKFGKDFVAAAVELRPDCGVNRLVIEKLSVRTPSYEVRLKLVKDIAMELGVEWDPTSVPSDIHATPAESLPRQSFQPADYGGPRPVPSDLEDGVDVDLPDLNLHLKPPKSVSGDGPKGNVNPPTKAVRFASPANNDGAGGPRSRNEEEEEEKESRYKDMVAEARAAAQSAERAATAAMAVAASLARANSVSKNVGGGDGSTTESTSSSEEEEEEEERQEADGHERKQNFGVRMNYSDGNEERRKSWNQPIFDKDTEEEEENQKRMQRDVSYGDGEDEDEDEDRKPPEDSRPPQRPPPSIGHHYPHVHPHVHPRLPNYDDLAARFEALKSKR